MLAQDTAANCAQAGQTAKPQHMAQLATSAQLLLHVSNIACIQYHILSVVLIDCHDPCNVSCRAARNAIGNTVTPARAKQLTAHYCSKVPRLQQAVLGYNRDHARVADSPPSQCMSG